MAESTKLHVVVFPWLALGHIIPFLELAKLIAQKGHKVSFVSTPRNIKRLPRLHSNLSPLIDLVQLPLPQLDDLPENTDATIDIPYTMTPYLKKAYDGLEPAMADFLESSTPDWVIYDVAPYWLPPITAKLGVSCAYFCTFSGWSMVFFGSASSMVSGTGLRKKPEDYTVAPEWVPFKSSVSLRLHEIKKNTAGIKENPSGVSETLRFGSVIAGCDVFLIRSCEELESDWLKVLGDIHQKTILPVGLLPPTVQDSVEKDETWLKISEWLHMQNKGSVVYIALGTEATPSEAELTELAHGLELSGLPFFWVLSKRPGSAENVSIELPNGFEERCKGRGVVWKGWVPQLRMLAHQSVGCFLTHCGWNSIVEGLQQGLSLIMLPLLWEQGLNARALEEKNVGLEIPRDERDGSFTRNSVAESLRLVMIEDRGRVYRDKAKEMSSIFGDTDLHQRYVENFVGYLQNHKSLQK